MKILILSDVHANEHALRAVLDAAPEHDQTLCLGDIVGYGEQLGLLLRADVAGRSAPRHEANSEQRTSRFVQGRSAAMIFSVLRRSLISEPTGNRVLPRRQRNHVSALAEPS